MWVFRKKKEKYSKCHWCHIKILKEESLEYKDNFFCCAEHLDSWRVEGLSDFW